MASVDRIGGLITGGLGRPACEQMISRGPGLGAFSLFCTVVVDTNPGGGGYYPKPAHNVLQPGNIKDFYKEVDLNNITPVQDDAAYELAQKYRVVIRLKIGSHEGAREYVVGRRRRNFIVSAVNFINNTTARIGVTVSNISSKTMRLAFKVKNMIYRNN